MPTADENVLEKVMPSSIEAEQAVIGSMILNPEAINVASELLVADDFYSRQYGIFFQTILEISNSGKPVDIVTLQDRLKEKDLPPEMYGVDTVRTLMKAVPTSANVKYYANIVAEKSMLRRMIRLNEEIAGNCYAGKESLEFIMGDTEKRMFQRP